MSRRTHRLIEQSIIFGMLFGIAGMFQPLTVSLFRYGFLLLLVSTLAFIIFSHVPARNEPLEEVGPVAGEAPAPTERR